MNSRPGNLAEATYFMSAAFKYEWLTWNRLMNDVLVVLRPMRSCLATANSRHDPELCPFTSCAQGWSRWLWVCESAVERLKRETEAGPQMWCLTTFLPHRVMKSNKKWLTTKKNQPSFELLIVWSVMKDYNNFMPLFQFATICCPGDPSQITPLSVSCSGPCSVWLCWNKHGFAPRGRDSEGII